MGKRIRCVVNFVILLAMIASLISPAGPLFPKRGAAQVTTYPHSFVPPYGQTITWDRTWEHVVGGAWTKAVSIPDTGLISIASLSYIGGGAAEAVIWIDIPFPEGVTAARVNVDASIIYAGGTQKFGISASAWGGVEKVWYIGNDYHREELDPVFGWDDITWAAIDLALLFLSAGAAEAGAGARTAAELQQLSRIKQIETAISMAGYIQNAAQMAQGFYDLYAAGEADRTNITFSFQSTYSARVGVGFSIWWSVSRLPSNLPGSGLAFPGGSFPQVNSIPSIMKATTHPSPLEA